MAFDDDSRGTCSGSLFLDFPDEPVDFPYYALFLDPGNALVLKAKPGNSSNTTNILTSNVINLNLARNPTWKGKAMVWKSMADAVRVGIATFVNNVGKKKDGADGDEDDDEDEEKKKPARVWDEKVDGPLKLEDILHVSGDQSWGPVTDQDPKVWVGVF
jgi:hypothetical protein